jgi:hypothetical protein|tara:strand:+ start:274 stop:615 length:342 start_codon:yes stop_codon:yes gene_type:complete
MLLDYGFALGQSDSILIIGLTAYVAFEPVQTIAFDIASPVHSAVFHDILNGLLKVPVTPEFVIIYSCKISMSFRNYRFIRDDVMAKVSEQKCETVSIKLVFHFELSFKVRLRR